MATAGRRNTDHLVTGDTNLQDLGNYQGVTISATCVCGRAHTGEAMFTRGEPFATPRQWGAATLNVDPTGGPTPTAGPDPTHGPTSGLDA